MMNARFVLRGRARGFALATALILGAAVALAAPLYHAELKKSEPADKAVLTAPPTELRLWFSEPPSLTLSKVTLTRGTDTVTVGRLTKAKPDSAPIVVKITKPIAPGVYVVHWRAMPDDGHVSNGTFGFRVKTKAANH